ncbi:MAG: hypothetical protein Kow0099_26060 [Candidatus Abyssubacteria bacterium]
MQNLNPKVAIEKVNAAPGVAIDRIFAKFPEVDRRLLECQNVFIKINAVYFHPHLHTSLPLIAAVVDHIKTRDPKKHIYLMENCSQGNFTRLCYAAIGVDALARKQRLHCLFLDEEKSVTTTIGEGDSELKIRFPRILYENLIENRPANFYLNMPVLKAHCQTQMTAGIKNQLGLLYDPDKAKNHNYRLHQKLVDILKFIKPDFTIVDALKVLARGPLAPKKYVEQLLHEKDVILGGEDIVAVDAVCASLLGYNPNEVKHVALAAQQGMGVADLAAITIDGEMPPCKQRIPWELDKHFPESVQIVVGKGGACYEGCLGHAEQILELLVNEKSAPENFSELPFTIVAGRGFDKEQLENLPEPILLLGECASKEVLETLRQNYLQIDVLNSCGRCDNILASIAQKLNIDVFELSPLSRLEIYRQFFTGRMRGLRYKIPR